MWMQRGIFREKASKAKPKFQKSFMYWAAIGKGYESKLTFIDGNINAEKYRNMFKSNHILEEIQVALPADRVSVHETEQAAIQRKPP
jgi:hypothetical protein